MRSGRFSSRWPALTYAQVEEIRKRSSRCFPACSRGAAAAQHGHRAAKSKTSRRCWVSGELFAVLGVKPAIGRVILPEDDRRGCGSPVAVISHAYWQRAFGGSPSVLRQTVRLEGPQFRIVGVTEPAFFGLDVGRRFDVAVPLCADPLLQNGVNRFELAPRMVAGRRSGGCSRAARVSRPTST